MMNESVTGQSKLVSEFSFLVTLNNGKISKQKS